MCEEKLQYFRCPGCGYEFKSDYIDSQLITMWAEDYGWVEEECPRCEIKFEVRERVERTYSIRTGARGRDGRKEN